MGSYADRLHGRIAVSAAARHFIDRFFPGDYKVIPNGVDIARFARAVPIARWQDGTRNILFVGRFESRKGLLDLLKAYRILRKTGCPCRLLVVGGGPQEREARRYIMTRRLGGVEFLGRVSDEERDALFKTADVYVSPATGRESFGIVLLEAMAAGTAIVCSDIHGYKGVVRRDRDALLVPPREPKALADAIGRLVSRRRRCGLRWRASGIERAEEFSWERVTGKVEDYYGFVIRRLAAQGALPTGFHAEVPPALRGRPARPRPSPCAAVSRPSRRSRTSGRRVRRPPDRPIRRAGPAC